MPYGQVFDLSDPVAVRDFARPPSAELLVTGSGEFRMELMRIDLDKLWMQRISDNLPRILHGEVPSNRTAILFLGDANQPFFRHSGVEVSPGELIEYRAGTTFHHRTGGASRTAAMSLAHADLAAVAKTLIGRELPAASQTRVSRPEPSLMTRLQTLHERVARLARESPHTLSHPATAKALEQELVHAMVLCLAADAPKATALGRHARIIARFEDLLASREYEPIYLAEICAAIGVSERTLRTCCQEYLGVGPIHYLWLRRMHLAHRALLRADPAAATVTDIATEYGFWELGRFSMRYRALFGESPSASLRRPRS